MPSRPLYEMVGKRFGRRLVLERVKNGPGGHPKYLCRCDCGKLDYVGGHDLRVGAASQCRICAIKERPAGYGKVIRNLLRNAKARAKKNGFPCTITLDDIFIPELCPLLGIPLIPADGAPTDCSPSLDRIIPERGYVPENIMVISYRANTIKQNATPQELTTLARNLEKIMRQKKLL